MTTSTLQLAEADVARYTAQEKKAPFSLIEALRRRQGRSSRLLKNWSFGGY
jgi:hypothetical protein